MRQRLSVCSRIYKIVGKAADNLSGLNTSPLSKGTFKSTLSPTYLFLRSIE